VTVGGVRARLEQIAPQQNQRRHRRVGVAALQQHVAPWLCRKPLRIRFQCMFVCDRQRGGGAEKGRQADGAAQVRVSNLEWQAGSSSAFSLAAVVGAAQEQEVPALGS